MTDAYLCGSIALLFCVVGIFLLRVSWRRQRRLLVLAGWVLVALAAAAWSLAVGVEYGVSYTAMALSVVAWLLVAGNRERQAAKPDSAAIDAATLPATSAAHKLGTFLAAGPLAAIASLLACALLVGAVFPVDERGNGLVLTAFVFPLVWAATAVWVCAVDRLLRPVGILLAIAVVASVGLMP